MRVLVERSGGFAGVVVRGEADTAQLEGTDPAAAQALRELVARADVADLARTAARGGDDGASGGRPRGADRFSYRIQVHADDDGGGALGAEDTAPQGIDVQLGEGDVPEALRPLIDHVLARRGHPAG